MAWTPAPERFIDAAIVLLVDAQGRVLLQQRHARAARFPGAWGLVGGGIEDGETRFADSGGVRGLVERLIAPRLLRRLYVDELDRRIATREHRRRATPLLPRVTPGHATRLCEGRIRNLGLCSLACLPSS